MFLNVSGGVRGGGCSWLGILVVEVVVLMWLCSLHIFGLFFDLGSVILGLNRYFLVHFLNLLGSLISCIASGIVLYWWYSLALIWCLV